MTFIKIKDVLERHKDKLLKLADVVGIGIGNKTVEGVDIGLLSIVIFVKVKLPNVKKKDFIPLVIEDVLIDVVETGEFFALARTTRYRPCPPGASIGHYRVTAGTFGCVVKKDGNEMILSNNHILANSNDARIGDTIMQPGLIDGGFGIFARLYKFSTIRFGNDGSTCPIANGVARLLNGTSWALGRRSRFRTEAIQPRQVNYVDAAIAIPVSDDTILTDIIDIGTPRGIGSPIIGMPVKKSGRTTGTTNGTILFTNSIVNVRYRGGTAQFSDQIMIGGGDFSSGGDSGSAIVTGDPPYLVGLLFAGGLNHTLANRIDRVFNTLGVTL